MIFNIKFHSRAFTPTASHIKAQGRERQRAHPGYVPASVDLHQSYYIARSPLRKRIDYVFADDLNVDSYGLENDVTPSE